MESYISKHDGRAKVKAELIEFDANVVVNFYKTEETFVKAFKDHSSLAQLKPSEVLKILKAVWKECVRVMEKLKQLMEKMEQSGKPKK